MDIAFSIAPIVILIFLMTKKNGLPSHVALPFQSKSQKAISCQQLSATGDRDGGLGYHN